MRIAKSGVTRKISAVIIAAIVVAAVAGAGVTYYYTSGAGRPPSTTTGPRVFKIVVLTSGGPDNSWIITITNGMTQARQYLEKTLGIVITVDYVYSVAYGDVQSVETTYANLGYDLIIPSDAAMEAATDIVAMQFPNTQFLGTSFSNLNYTNVANASWDVWQAYYPAGVLAGYATKTGIIGFVVGFSFTQSNQAMNAFLAGARLVNPNTRLLYSLTQDWHDPVKGAQAASALIAAGADVIAGMGNGMTDGMIKQAAESGVYSIGYFYDENPLAPQYVLTSCMWNFTNYVIAAVPLAMAHQLGAPDHANIAFSLSEGGAYLAPFHETLPPNILAEANVTIAKMFSGELPVPTDSTRPG